MENMLGLHWVAKGLAESINMGEANMQGSAAASGAESMAGGTTFNDDDEDENVEVDEEAVEGEEETTKTEAVGAETGGMGRDRGEARGGGGICERLLELEGGKLAHLR